MPLTMGNEVTNYPTCQKKRIFEFKRFTHEPIGLEDFAAHLSDRQFALLLSLQMDLTF